MKSAPPMLICQIFTSIPCWFSLEMEEHSPHMIREFIHMKDGHIILNPILNIPSMVTFPFSFSFTFIQSQSFSNGFKLPSQRKLDAHWPPTDALWKSYPTWNLPSNPLPRLMTWSPRGGYKKQKRGGGALKKGGGRKGKGLVWGGFDKYPTKESLEASLLLRLLHFPL
jgi:hypothetical protein